MRVRLLPRSVSASVSREGDHAYHFVRGDPVRHSASRRLTASAQEPRASVQGFGGLGMGSFTTPNTNFGGVITGSLTPNIQLIGEAGRLGNILPSTTQMLFDLSPVALQRVGVLCARAAYA